MVASLLNLSHGMLSYHSMPWLRFIFFFKGFFKRFFWVLFQKFLLKFFSRNLKDRFFWGVF